MTRILLLSISVTFGICAGEDSLVPGIPADVYGYLTYREGDLEFSQAIKEKSRTVEIQNAICNWLKSDAAFNQANYISTIGLLTHFRPTGDDAENGIVLQYLQHKSADVRRIAYEFLINHFLIAAEEDGEARNSSITILLVGMLNDSDSTVRLKALHYLRSSIKRRELLYVIKRRLEVTNVATDETEFRWLKELIAEFEKPERK